MNINFIEAFERTKVAGSIAAGSLDEINKIIKALDPIVIKMGYKSQK